MDTKQNIIIYNSDDGWVSVALYAQDGNIWLNQNQIAELFDTSKQNIWQHIQNILEEWELSQEAVVKNYFTTASDGKKYDVAFYNLQMIMAIGFRVRSQRWLQFRVWASKNLSEYLVKWFIIDDERLKNPDNRPDYFDELLARIRDIRASEKRFYQKIKDLFILSSDYNPDDKATQMFFAETQNKLLFAITGKTAAEIIISRANADAENMNLTSWKWKIVRKQDIFIAKNYLTADEIENLNRFVVVFLETAELRAKNFQDITISFWKETVDKIIEFNGKKNLLDKWKISNKQMEEIVEQIYENFDKKRKIQEAKDEDLKELKEVEKFLKSQK